MSVETSANGHIEVVTANFNEFSQGLFRIKIFGTDQKTAINAIIYDTLTTSSVVQIKQGNNIKSSSEVLTLGNSDNNFAIEAQLDNDDNVTYGDYSFDVVVMSNEQRHPIIDSITITGTVVEAFVEPLNCSMTIGENNTYNFEFSPVDGDGPLNKISGYKVLSVDNGIELRNADNNDLLTLGSIATNIKAIRKESFNGRIIFAVSAVDINGLERTSQCSVNKYDSSIAVAPTLVTTGFNPQLNKNNILAIYEASSGNILSTGTIRFVLDQSMYDDGNFELSWQLLQGEHLIKINNDLTSSDIAITKQNNSPALLTFRARDGKFGALFLMYELKYMGDAIEGTRRTIELDIKPSNDITLTAQHKRIYMMNKHKINLNDVSEDGYNAVQSFSGAFRWSEPNAVSPIDDFNDGAAVASFIAAKSNFDRTTIANIAKFDKYDGRDYDWADQTISVDIPKIRIALQYSNNGDFLFKTTQANIDAMVESMQDDELDDIAIAEQLSYWTASDSLESTDIIFDPTPGFYGRINITYAVRDTLDNESNSAVVSLLVCPYSHLRVKSMTGGDSTMLLQDVSAPLSFVIENSNSDDDRYDFLEHEDQEHVRTHMSRFSKGDIDFTRMITTIFKLDNENIDPANVLQFHSIVDPDNVTHHTIVAINGIYWTDSVTLNQTFVPGTYGTYDFNFKILANVRSISGNSQYVFAKEPPHTVEIGVFNNTIDRFREIRSESIIANSLTIVDTSNNPQNLFVVDESGVNCALPVVIEENDNSDSLIVNGIATIDTLHAGDTELGSVVVAGNVTATRIITDDIVVHANLNAENGSFETLEVTGDLTVESVVINGNISVENINASQIVSNTITTNTVSTATIDASGDVSILGSLIVDSIGAFNSGIEVSGETDTENVNVAGTLTVGGVSLLADTNVDSLVADYDSEFRSGLFICNSQVSISEEDGFVTELPVTIGSGTLDYILTVNGSVATYGDFSINDTDILFEEGVLNIAVETNIGSEDVNANLNVYGDIVVSGNLVVNNFELSGDINVAKINASSDIVIRNVQQDAYPDYNLVKHVTDNDSTNLSHYDYASCVFILFTNTSSSTVPVYVASALGMQEDSIDVESGMSTMFMRIATDFYNSNYYPQWVEIARMPKIV